MDSELSAQEYLERYSIPFYLRDVTSLLLQCRDDRPLEFISEYFSEVLNGTHVLLRDFSYVSRCSHDRWAFVQAIREALADLDQDRPVSASVLTQLLRLLCPDFPLEVATDACRLCGDERAAHPLGEVLHATCVRICFADLLRRAADAFRACDPHNRGRAERPALLAALRLAAAQAQQAAELTGEDVPPADFFEGLVAPATADDLSLADLLRAFVQSQFMRNLMLMPSPEDEGGEGGEGSFHTLVASPPKNDASSPGSACAAACAAAALAAATAASGGRRGPGRAARERLAEAAAAAASGTRRGAVARPSSAAPRRGRAAAGSSFAAASRLMQQAPPPPGSPR
jgi:hypothetical protein